MKNWTIILHFGRGHSETKTGLTKEQAQEMLRIAVFANEDSVNANVFRS
jgi:hypothetical protein